MSDNETVSPVQRGTGLSLDEAAAALSSKFAGEDEPQEEINEVSDTVEDDSDAVEESELPDDSMEAAEDADEVDEVGDEDGPEEVEAEEAGWESLDELLEAGSTNLEELSAQVTVGGQAQTVTLKEALNGYQRQADYDRQMQSIRSEKENLKESAKRLDETMSKLQEAHALAGGYWDAELKNLQKKRESIDWNAIRQQDEGRYAALQADFDAEERAVKRQMEEVEQGWKKVQEEIAQEQHKAYQQRVVDEGKALLEKLPHWQEQSVLDKEGAEVTQYLMDSAGFSKDDIGGFVDHRAMVLAYKAMKFDALQAAGQDVVKNPKVAKKRPKRVLRPGMKRNLPPQSVKGKQVRQLEARLKKSGSEQDAIELFQAKHGLTPK